MNVFDELMARGIIAQMTDEEKIKELLTKDKIRFYIGLTPLQTACGTLCADYGYLHLQKAGHPHYPARHVLSATNGKTEMRKMLSKEEIQHNIECFKTQM